MKILEFDATPGFRGYDDHFTKESTGHPAKANIRLLDWIISEYTDPGDLVLDPMAGTGSTGVAASVLGRDAILVELEPKFCDMIRANVAKSLSTEVIGDDFKFVRRGRFRVIQGDARNLSGLLADEVEVAVFSPPYSIVTKGLEDIDKWDTVKAARIKNFQRYMIRPYSFDPTNIGNLRHGDVDVVLSSPPYGQTVQGNINSSDYDRIKDMPGFKGRKAWDGRVSSSRPLHYSESGDNIGNLDRGDIDAALTSPPYSVEPGAETYLSAMLKVYRECWKVLKRDGLMILILKNFIRDKRVVWLDLDTIRLCVAAGFRLVDRHVFKLPGESFFRVAYRQRCDHSRSNGGCELHENCTHTDRVDRPNCPDYRPYGDFVPDLGWEDVLVFQKEVKP